jgi:hypothetical protein
MCEVLIGYLLLTVVTVRVSDIGQNFSKPSFHTRRGNSPSYFRIVFLIVFLGEAFIRNIIVILCIDYIIITFIINNSYAVISNKLWKNPRPHFSLQNSHGHTGELLRNL